MKCFVCNKDFHAPPSAIKRGTKCCSVECRNKARKGSNSGSKHYNWQGGEIVKSCLVCKKDFTVKREQEKRTGAKFCSLNCRSIYNVRYKHGSINTDIERIIEKILIGLKIYYRKQVSIDGIALVDFLVDTNKIIQCDGDYWHSLPLTIERDKRQDAYLRTHGYTILRLKGSEIKKQKQLCIDKINSILTVENRADNVGLRGNQ
jgi:very-short-patch-repair endonuclease